MGGRRFMGEICRKFYKEVLDYLAMKKEVAFGGVLGDSWNLFRSKFGLFALIAFVFSFIPTVAYGLFVGKSTVADAIANQSTREVVREILFVVPGSIVVWILSLLVSLSVIFVLNNEKKKGMTFGDAVKGGAGFLIAGILVSLLLVVFLIPLFILLIIPGLIFAIYWTFSFNALVIDKTSVRKSLTKSHEVVRGRWWKVFGYVFLLSIIIAIFSGITGAIFGAFGLIGYLLQTAVITLTAVFFAIFMNTFYLGLKGSR